MRIDSMKLIWAMVLCVAFACGSSTSKKVVEGDAVPDTQTMDLSEELPIIPPLDLKPRGDLTTADGREPDLTEDGSAPPIDLVDDLAVEADLQVDSVEAEQVAGLPVPEEDYEANWEPNPFEVCVQILAQQEASRPRCDSVDDRQVWTVGKDGGQDFETIQAAIDASVHCDVIIVRPGVYQEYLVVEGKDVAIYSDVIGEDGETADGDEEVELTTERIDLGLYYDTAKKEVLETSTAHRKVLKRTLRTVLTGNYDDYGSKLPMVDFAKGTTRNSILDGFTIEYMPWQDHTIPGHAHAINCRGSSPVVRNNIIRYNGSTGVGVHASFKETNDEGSVVDFRTSNIEHRPSPLALNNISYENNGLGFGNNHYSCAIFRGGESFWNYVPGHPDHASPGIGSRHGAKTLIEDNIVYENGWGGITQRQGDIQGEPGKAIDERTITIVRNNVSYNNGHDDVLPKYLACIGVDGAGTAEEPVIVEGNTVYDSQVTGIGVRNEYSGEGYAGTDTYVELRNNTVYSSTNNGLACLGSGVGSSHCRYLGNVAYGNGANGIYLEGLVEGWVYHNVTAYNDVTGVRNNSQSSIEIANNIFFMNVKAGLFEPFGNNHHNLAAGNNGTGLSCPPGPPMCKNKNFAAGMGGAGPGEGTVLQDPLFVNPEGNEYQLQAGSPAINAGFDSGQVEYNGSAPDLGAFETAE